MARWGKNIVVPLESLIKEKENTNRPTAARSAGTVGKWGKMGFTSTRTYALKALPAIISSVPSSDGGDGHVSQTNDPPKPKKFFKSRNSSVVARAQIIHHLPRAPPSPIRETVTQRKEPPLKLKIPKPRSERKKSTASEKGSSKSDRKKKEKKLKPEAPPSRIISRHRKVVNYAEDDDDRSQTPFRDIIVPKTMFAAENNLRPQHDVTSVYDPEVEDVSETGAKPKVSAEQEDVLKDVHASANRSTSLDHPPIVLRISKGTSRLISTDSEDIISSPIYEPMITDPSTKRSIADPYASDQVEDHIDHELAQINSSTNPCEGIPDVTSELKKSQDSPPKHESLKIVIKADVLKNAMHSEKIEKKSKTKKHHKNSSINLKVNDNQFKTPSPLPSNELDLYKTLGTSPSERDFDSQSSILGSISSKGTNQFQAVITDENCVIRSRGSSEVTSELESSQHSSLVAPPSDIESRLESMMDGDDDDQTGLNDSNILKSGTKLILTEVESLKEDILKVLTGELDSTKKENDEKEVTTNFEPGLESTPNQSNQLPNSEVTEGFKEEEETRRMTRSRRVAAKNEVSSPIPEPSTKLVRFKRSNNGILRNKVTPVPIRSYSRKRKLQSTSEIHPQNIAVENEAHLIEKTELSTSIDLPDAPHPSGEDYSASSEIPDLIEDEQREENLDKEYKVKNKFKRTWYERSTKPIELDLEDQLAMKKIYSEHENSLVVKSKSNKTVNNNTESGEGLNSELACINEEKRSVKLVISKKKGSIFKSRALVAHQGDSKKRHIYKHTWDAEDKKEKSALNEEQSVPSVSESVFDEFTDIESEPKFTRVTRQNTGKFDSEAPTSVKCDRKTKEYYTVVRNVKTAHQIQEIGEYQEMDDDVEYILDALQPHNPISTRCLSALQLASKCMTPGFRMHVRAHGTVTKFFKALRDAKKDLSLGLCTATIMFVLSQDTLNMDLDRDSLELMMDLLEVDATNIVDECGLANFERNKLKVKELCEDIKNQGKANHLNLESISVGTLAMETLLSLTSKRAGEWFKEELRELGGLEHIIKTICECCHQISDYVVSWTDVLLDKLRTIERCLRVLENVSQQNEKNQDYILCYGNGDAVNTLFKLYKLCDSEIALYPTNDSTPKENPGVVLREALVPTLKVLINLTHPFDENATGSAVLGQRDGIFDTSFHILLQAPNYVPERCIFELNILVLLLLINLTMYTNPNRSMIMRSHAPSDFGNQFDKVPAIKALIEYFYRCEEQARLAEKNTDAILENPEAANKKPQSQEEVDETVTKLLQKAGHHMEHSLKASYAGILIGHLISNSEENEKVIRTYLRNNSFNDIITILEKYYNFMTLTASFEAIVVSHIKSTKNLIDYFKKCEQHSKPSEDNEMEINASISSTRSHRVYKTYSQR